MRAEIFLNVSPRATLTGYRQGDSLRNVYHLEVNADDDATALEICFQTFSSQLPRDYHTRPVSVGDVIRLNGERMWAVDTQGWLRVPEYVGRGPKRGQKTARLIPPEGVSSKPHERSRFRGKNKMSNEEAVAAMKTLGHDFSGHEDEIHEILNKVRRDEWPGIVAYYVD